MKNKKILLVIIIFLILVLIAFAGVYAYITLDVFRTPKQLFGKYLDNQIEQVKNMNTGALKTVSENLKTVPSQSDYSMKVKANYGGEDISFSYKQTMILNPENFEGMLKLKATLESMDDETIIGEDVPELPLEVMDYTLYGSKDKVVIKIPELNEKYFSVKTDTIFEKTQNVLKEQNISNIELSKESIEKYKNEFKNLYNKYLEEIKNKFTDDKFSKEKNVEVDVNGTKQTANKYIFSMTSSELKTTYIDLLTKLSDEPILSELMTDDQISNLKDSISELTDNIEVINEDKTLRVCIYENAGNTIKIELQANDEILAEVMTSKISDSETNLTLNIISKKQEDGEVGATQTIVYNVNSENENTTTVTTTTSTTYNKEDIDALKKYYKDNNYYYYTDEMVEENYKNTTTSETIKTTVNGNTATSKISIKGNNDESKVQISDTKIEYKFGIKPEFENFENEIKLDEYLDNDEKTSQLIMECMQNLQENPNTFLGGVYKIFSSFSNFQNDFSNEINENDSDKFSFGNSEDSSSDKTEIQSLITEGLNSCLDSYKRDLEEDPNVNVSDYLTINKISEMILSSNVSDLEMIDGSTLKCKYNDEVYYIKLVLNGDTLKVDSAIAYTENEYQEL